MSYSMPWETGADVAEVDPVIAYLLLHTNSLAQAEAAAKNLTPDQLAVMRGRMEALGLSEGGRVIVGTEMAQAAERATDDRPIHRELTFSPPAPYAVGGVSTGAAGAAGATSSKSWLVLGGLVVGIGGLAWWLRRRS